jgi:alpha-tubulin N-acetyltransferase 1
MKAAPGSGMNAHRTSSFMGGKRVDQNSSSDEKLTEIVDRMGEASAKAQKLPQVITTTSRLFTSDNKVFMRTHQNKVIGFIKTGRRNLFCHTAGGMKEIKPICVLDFYVHESC